MAKNRKITETNKAFYKLGFQDGEAQLKRTITVLETTNRHLWDELTRLDRTSPVVGVLLNYETIDQMIKNARKGTKNSALAKKLKAMKDKAQKRDAKTVLLSIK